MSLPNPTNVLELLSSGDPMTKAEILNALGTYEEAKATTEDLDAMETFEFYTNLDGLFYSSIKRIRKHLKKERTGMELVSIEKKFQITRDAETMQAYLATPQRVGRTGSYLEGMTGLQAALTDEVENGAQRTSRITEASKRYKSWAKIA